jgi:uncharacterized protein
MASPWRVQRVEARLRRASKRGKATTPTEKSICADLALAAWDRSAALAFREASERSASEDLLADQKAWLKERDACGDKRACLEERMIVRVGELVRN